MEYFLKQRKDLTLRAEVTSRNSICQDTFLKIRSKANGNIPGSFIPEDINLE